MECPKCSFQNPEKMKFCGECGFKLEKLCPKCNFNSPPSYKFCGECGYNLNNSFNENLSVNSDVLEKPVSHDEPEQVHIELASTIDKKEPFVSQKDIGARKYVTVLFSDMSGYTSMSEKLDPEEVKEITKGIFGRAANIISKYGGFVEKYIGDALVAIFGATESHEDDPIRAIRAAIEIHTFVDQISPEYEHKIGCPLSMHSGINTGLVVTGEIDFEKGTHGIAGDTINVAARFSSFGKDNDILVGYDTYTWAEGYFNFKNLPDANLKGKQKPVKIFKVLSVRNTPKKTYRLQGVRADLIGRERELIKFGETVKNLKSGKGTVICLYGYAGTGKSRLVEEFKAVSTLR